MKTRFCTIVLAIVLGHPSYTKAGCLSLYNNKIEHHKIFANNGEYEVIAKALELLAQSSVDAIQPELEQILLKTWLLIREKHGAQLKKIEADFALSVKQLYLMLQWYNNENILCLEGRLIKYKEFINMFPFLHNMYVIYKKSLTAETFLQRASKNNMSVGQKKQSTMFVQFLAHNIDAFFKLSPSLENAIDIISIAEEYVIKNKYNIRFLVLQKIIEHGLIKQPAEFLRLIMSLPAPQTNQITYGRLWKNFILGHLEFFLTLQPTLEQIMSLHDYGAQEQGYYHEISLTIKSKSLFLIKSGDDYLKLLRTIRADACLEEKKYIEMLQSDAIDLLIKDPNITIEDLETIKINANFILHDKINKRIGELLKILDQERLIKANKRANHTFRLLRKLLRTEIEKRDKFDFDNYTIDLPPPEWLYENFLLRYEKISSFPLPRFNKKLPCPCCDIVEQGKKSTVCKSCWREYLQQEIKDKSYPVVDFIDTQRWISAREIIAAGVKKKEFNIWQRQMILHIFRHHKHWQSCGGANCINGRLLSDARRGFLCAVCHVMNCGKCQATHPELTCAQYQKGRESQAAFEQWFIKSEAQCCPYVDCQVPTEKNGGCLHMICKSCKKDWHWTEGVWTKELTTSGRFAALGPYALSLGQN